MYLYRILKHENRWVISTIVKDQRHLQTGWVLGSIRLLIMKKKKYKAGGKRGCPQILITMRNEVSVPQER